MFFEDFQNKFLMVYKKLSQTAGGLRPVTGGLLGFAEKGVEPLPVRAEAFGQVARGGFPEPGPGFLTRRKAGKKDDAVPSVSEA